MKKTLRKMTAVALITIIIYCILDINAKTINAVEKNESVKFTTIQKNKYENLKSSIKRSEYNNLMAGNGNLESTYNISNNNELKVKNQKNLGSCWSFAFTSMIESTMKNGKEYSPMHIEYKTNEMFNRELSSGGNFYFGLAYLSSGNGPIYESDFPFDSVYKENSNNGKENLIDPSEVDLSKYKTRATLKDATNLPSIYKTYNSDGTITYKNGNTSDANIYSKEEVNAIRTKIKEHIKEKGGIVSSFYSDIGITNDGVYKSEHGYYNSEKSAYYGNGKNFESNSTNHAVTIVGWDDNFSKDNFLDGNKPANDGAYIVLNSYGKEFGKNGYFYVSYDDFGIEQSMVEINEIKEESSNAVKYTYQYDELGGNIGIAGEVGKPMYAANVFKKKDTSHTENLSEIGVTLLEADGIEVYVNPNDDDISKCKLVATYTGDNALDSGYHVLKLSSPIELTGEKFVIKIKYINTEGAFVPLECNLKESNIQDEEIEKLFENAKSNHGESFISGDDIEWNDIYNYKLDDGTVLKNTSATIKAFTTQGNEKISVTGVELNKTSVSINVGETSNLIATVKPENAKNKNVKWTSSNENIVTVNEDGIITAIAEGEAKITATTLDGNYTAECNVTVKKSSNSDNDIYKDNKNNYNKNNESGYSNNEKNIQNNNDEVANVKLPQTGAKSKVILIIVAVIFVVILYKKRKRYKNIK